MRSPSSGNTHCTAPTLARYAALTAGTCRRWAVPVGVFGTEFLSPRRGGVGDLIWQSWNIYAIEKMFVGLIVTGLMGWLLTISLDVVERVALPWTRG